jgi:Na+-transporting NADH:ubiquinone oxidoreductase subunit NqrA
VAKIQGGNAIDFANLDKAQLDKMKTAVKVLSEYDGEITNINESKKQTLDDLVTNMGADKDSAKKLKKYVKVAARARRTDGAEEIRDDNTAIERLLIALGELSN